MWEVQQWCLCGGWTNTWFIETGGRSEPQRFPTEAEAWAELNAYIAEIEDAIANGELTEDSAMDVEEFRVVPVSDGGAA